jgi:lipase maturation factor 1
MVRSIFLRGLAIVYLIAFGSLLPQMDGLIGSHGILPAHDYLQNVRTDYGAAAYGLFPTLAWFNSSDTFLHVIVWTGVALAVLLLIGVSPFPAALGLYLLYLSVDTIGQAFYSFQWDSLLLEAGFAALLVTPVGLRPSYKKPPSRLAVWVFRFLIFRLMLESGAVKLLSGDRTWRSLTALNYHYQTQPLPTPVAWYAHQLPSFVQKLSIAGVFVVELIVPFLFLAPRRFRIVGAWMTIGFQLVIALTGNYTFFNLLTILLCVFLFDGKYEERAPWNVRFVAVVLIAVGFLQLLTTFGVAVNLPEPFRSMDFRAETFHLVNHYGLFAIMTTSRNEIVIEGSDDGNIWKDYEFKYKPGDVYRRLPWVAPYQPRLDWQMWFAALSNYESNPWFQQVVVRLLEGRPEVTSLLAANPFPNQPPRFIRAVSYDYRFTDWDTRRKTGAVWSRGPLGQYFPPVSLKR